MDYGAPDTCGAGGTVSAKSYWECCVNAESSDFHVGTVLKNPFCLVRQIVCRTAAGERQKNGRENSSGNTRIRRGFPFSVKPETKAKADSVKQSIICQLAPADLLQLLPQDPPKHLQRTSTTLWSQALHVQPAAHTQGENRRHLAEKQKCVGALLHIWASRQCPDS